MTARLDSVGDSLTRLHNAAAAVGRAVRLMEVCGTHTMSAFRSGLHSLMPANVTLLSGPGCPVCVTAQGDIDLTIALALEHDVTLCTYGDMLRVPGRRGSLEQARGAGADVRVVYSAIDAVKLAASHRQRRVVFAAVGFETTAPASAAAVLQARARDLRNFTILASHKRVVPAMQTLVNDPAGVAIDGFLCPGHVSVIIGAEAYRPLVERHRMPCVIGGFEEPHMAAALAALVEQVRDGVARLDNAYPQVVSPGGNRAARACIDAVFQPVDARWRGLGVIPASGLAMHGHLARYDAMKVYALRPLDDREPAGCLCGQVIAGKVRPPACRLFGAVCTPINPIGPCMVSSEGTCSAYFKYGRAGTPRAKAPLKVSAP